MDDAPILICYDRSADSDRAIEAAAALLGPRRAVVVDIGPTLTASESVAALEGIRLDLLRLHAGGSDLAPLTTLIDAARQIGEDVDRLAEAQREVEGTAG